MRWGKIAADFHSNPKTMAAGRLGREVFVFALCLNAGDPKQKGRLRIGYFGANYLSARLQISVEDAAAGFDACIATELLRVDEKFVVIVGWNETEWGSPRDGATRTRQWREGKPDNSGDGAVTETRRVVTTSDACDALEKRREEKKRSNAHSVSFDFESVYKLYPRKAGKQQGLKKLQAKIRSEADYQALLGAVQRMSHAWRGAELTYCPHWSTFVNQERWLDDELPVPGREESPKAAAADLAPGVERW